MKRCIAACAAAAMMFGQTCLGATLKKADIAPDAKWVVHIDVERLLSSEIGKLKTDETTNEQLAKRMAAAKEKVGFHPLKDVTGVTMYGRNIGSRQGIVLLKGNANLQALAERARADKACEQISHGNRTLYKKTGPEGKRCIVAHFHDSGVVILGASAETVQKAMDVLDGKAAGEACSVPNLPSDSFFMAWSENPGKGGIAPPRAVVLQNSRKGMITMGEQAGNFQLDISVTADSAAKGDLIRQIMTGVRAYAALLAGESSFGKLVDAAKIGGSGEGASVKMSYSSKELYDILKTQKGRLCPMFWRRHHGRRAPADAD